MTNRNNKHTFAMNLVKRLNSDVNSPFFKQLNSELSSQLYKYLIVIMDNDTNRNKGFELIIDLYRDEDEMYKNILPIIKSYFNIAKNVMNIDILNIKNLKFLFNNLDKIMDKNLLENWEINLHNLLNFYEEDISIEKFKNTNEESNLLKFK